MDRSVFGTFVYVSDIGNSGTDRTAEGELTKQTK